MAAEADVQQQQVPDLSGRDAWQFDDYVQAGRAAIRAEDDAAWVVGDLADSLVTTYGEHDLERWAEALDMPLRTVQNRRTVARAFPEKSRRRDFSWSVHAALASAASPALALSARDDWTVAMAREAAAKARREIAAARRAEPGESDGVPMKTKQERTPVPPGAGRVQTAAKYNPAVDPYERQPQMKPAEPSSRPTVPETPAVVAAPASVAQNRVTGPACGHDSDWHVRAGLSIDAAERAGHVESKLRQQIATLESELESLRQKVADKFEQHGAGKCRPVVADTPLHADSVPANGKTASSFDEVMSSMSPANGWA